MDMPSVSPQRVTQLLADWSHGDDAALAELTPLVYEELRRLAGQAHPSFTNRSHFFAVAAQAMRQILVNYAKASQSQKRGGGALKVDLDAAALISPEQTTEILDVHEALDRLATLDSRKAHVVELKYFGGLKHDEIAEVLKISTVTVRRDWVFAKAWLYGELHDAT